MDISAGKTKLGRSRTGSSSMLNKKVSDIIGWMVVFFTLTKEDRIQAGICVGSEGVTERSDHGILSHREPGNHTRTA